MPELLVELLDESGCDNPRVQNIVLAGQFARHLARGWDNPALPDDFSAIGALVHLGREPLLKRLGVPAEAAARYLPKN